MEKHKEFLNIIVDRENDIHLAFIAEEKDEFCVIATASLRVYMKDINNPLAEENLSVYGRENSWTLYLAPEERIELRILGLKALLSTDSDMGTATLKVCCEAYDATFQFKQLVTTSVVPF